MPPASRVWSETLAVRSEFLSIRPLSPEASLRTAEQNGCYGALQRRSPRLSMATRKKKAFHLIFLNLQTFSNAPFARLTFAALNSHRFNVGGLNGNLRVVARYPWA